MNFRNQLRLKTWQRRMANWNLDAWLVFVLLLVIALNLTLVFRIILPVPFWLSGIGMLMVTVAVAVIIGGQAMITRALEKSTGLVTRGIYRYSRHPMYVGFAMLFIGVGLGRERLWFIVVGVLTPVVFNWLVVPKEEKEIEKFYGQAWQTYAKKTPRWL